MAHKLNPSHRSRHRITVCHRHPDTGTTTGLCAPCLRDRLSLLTPSTSSAAADPTPELRRCKTFSSNNNSGFSRVSYEPRRRSCDVNNGNKSLSSLFHLDDDECSNGGDQVPSSVIESKNLGLGFPVPEVEEEGENEIEDEEIDESNEESKTMKEFIDLEFRSQTSKPSSNGKKDLKEMVGSFCKKLQKWRKKQHATPKRGDSSVGLGEMRLESLRGRRLRDSHSEFGEYRGGRRSCDVNADVDVDYRGRDSIDYGRASIDCGVLGVGFSRPSCDSDPRFSIDLGRGGSIDEGRCSFDGPRASLDGYLVSRRGTLPPLPPLPPPCGSNGPVVSTIDEGRCSFDAPRASWDGYLVGRRGTLPPPCGSGGAVVSAIDEGGCSFDAPRASWDGYLVGRRTTLPPLAPPCGSGGPVVLAIDEGRCSFDAPRASLDGYLVGRRGKFAPLAPPCGANGPVVSVIENAMATVYGFDHSHRVLNEGKTKGFDGGSRSIKEGSGGNETKLLITEKELNEWRLNSGKDDNSSESFETASKDLASVASSSNGNYFKECRQWRKLWGLWGFLHRKKGDQCSNEVKVCSRNGEKQARAESDRKLARSLSTTSSRGSSSTMVGSVGSKPESNALVRNRSSKLSHNHLENGLLRFYLTPLRSSRRSKLGKSRLKNAPSLARSMLR